MLANKLKLDATDMMALAADVRALVDDADAPDALLPAAPACDASAGLAKAAAAAAAAGAARGTPEWMRS